MGATRRIRVVYGVFQDKGSANPITHLELLGLVPVLFTEDVVPKTRSPPPHSLRGDVSFCEYLVVSPVIGVLVALGHSSENIELAAGVPQLPMENPIHASPTFFPRVGTVGKTRNLYWKKDPDWCVGLRSTYPVVSMKVEPTVTQLGSGPLNPFTRVQLGNEVKGVEMASPQNIAVVTLHLASSLAILNMTNQQPLVDHANQQRPPEWMAVVDESRVQVVNPARALHDVVNTAQARRSVYLWGEDDVDLYQSPCPQCAVSLVSQVSWAVQLSQSAYMCLESVSTACCTTAAPSPIVEPPHHRSRWAAEFLQRWLDLMDKCPASSAGPEQDSWLLDHHLESAVITSASRLFHAAALPSGRDYHQDCYRHCPFSLRDLFSPRMCSSAPSDRLGTLLCPFYLLATMGTIAGLPAVTQGTPGLPYGTTLPARMTADDAVPDNSVNVRKLPTPDFHVSPAACGTPTQVKAKGQTKLCMPDTSNPATPSWPCLPADHGI
eukprot:gene6335-154_t